MVFATTQSNKAENGAEFSFLSLSVLPCWQAISHAQYQREIDGKPDLSRWFFLLFSSLPVELLTNRAFFTRSHPSLSFRVRVKKPPFFSRGDFSLTLEEGRGGLFYVARQPLPDPKPPTLSETDFVLHVWRPLICRFPHRKSCFAYGKAPSTANSTKVMLV